MSEDEEGDVITGEKCPMCLNQTLELRQAEKIVPHFGPTVIFSMRCTNEECGFYKSDVESLEDNDEIEQTFKIEEEDDLNITVVKSSTAEIKFYRIGTIEATEQSSGYITTIEGLIKKMKRQLEGVRDSVKDKDKKDQAKRHLKKLQRVIWGRDSLKLKLTDPEGNSKMILEQKES